MVGTRKQKACGSICRARRIAELNDQLRTTGIGGQIFITCGVRALTGADVSELMRLLAAFDAFDRRNDPYRGHDFGVLRYHGAELMWKIDYYRDADLRLGSDEPANANVTYRVLTIMLAEEY